MVKKNQIEGQNNWNSDWMLTFNKILNHCQIWGGKNTFYANIDDKYSKIQQPKYEKQQPKTSIPSILILQDTKFIKQNTMYAKSKPKLMSVDMT